MSYAYFLEGFAAGLKGICSFVFEREDDFTEILAFTNDMSRQYNLNVHTLHADFRSGVEGLLETTQLKAIILGTRRYFVAACETFTALPLALFSNQDVKQRLTDVCEPPLIHHTFTLRMMTAQKLPNMCRCCTK